MKMFTNAFSTLLFGFLIFTFTTCFAYTNIDYMPSSEFSLGGIPLGASKSYVLSVYGEPQSRGHDGDCFTYGDSFTIVFNNDKAKFITVSAKNGITTPSGFRVGISISNVKKKYPNCLLPEPPTSFVAEDGGGQIMRFWVRYFSYIKKIEIYR